MYRKYVRKWLLLKRNRIIWPEVAVNRHFLLGKSIFLIACKNQNFRKFAWKTRYSFVKLPEKIEIFRKFACRNRNFLPGSTTPQISNQIDAVVAILLLISLWHHPRLCYLSSRIPGLVL